MKPLAIDLFCGKGGWTNGLQAAGYQCIGFDIADMGGYPGELVLQDVLTLNGAQFRKASLIVASPPCQKYSYMAMPWSRAKELAAWYRADEDRIKELNALFNACFRIAREAGVPLVVENVKGAQPWVGPAKAHYGSFYLWGDVDSVGGAIVAGRMKFGRLLRTKRVRKVPGFNFHQFEKTGAPGGSFQTAAVKISGENWSRFRKTGEVSTHWNMQAVDGVKQGGNWWHDPASMTRRFSSRSAARKEASARIAMIPFDLALHIGQCFI